MVRFSAVILLAALLSACASGPADPGAAPSPDPVPATTEQPASGGQPEAPAGQGEAPGPTEPAEGPTRESSSTADPGSDPGAAAAPAFRRAPDRWWYQTMEEGIPGAGIDEAYQILSNRPPQREVVVAIIDGGIDIAHEDLDDVLWTNPDEIPGNGADDDGNGYVDDVHGWSFLGGPDGESVNYDTFELTRVHAACIGEPAGNGTPEPDPGTCAKAAEAYQAEVEEYTALAENIGQIEQLWPAIVEMLRQEVGAEPTFENVLALETTNPQLAQVRDIFLQLTAAGLDAETLADEAESIRGRLDYGLDLTFDPRPIVGDDYADVSERHYGSPDVAGPDPGHGTAVASVAGAERDNGIGLDGAGDGIRIMAVRAVPNGDERDKDVANAIRYAVDNGAHVVNMSFGKDYSPWKEEVDDAIHYAEERGVLLVHASGNDGEDLRTNASFPEHEHREGVPELWIEVGASSWEGPDSLAASFTNYGAERVDLFAPGVAIVSATPGNGYRPTDGTSVAAPVVTGIAGMLMAYFPELSAAEVRTILLETATDLGERMVARPGDPGGTVPFGELSTTGGIVNARAAVERAFRVTSSADSGPAPASGSDRSPR